MHNALTGTIDFETKSACNLKACGSWIYSLHPTTDILCLGFRLPYWKKGHTALWHPASSNLVEGFPGKEISELLEWIAAGKLLTAHNIWFDKNIWRHVLVPRYDWPPVPETSWQCSMAKAAAHALPRAVEKIVPAMNLPVDKDMVGHKAMMKASKPRKSWKKERDLWEKTGVTPPTLLWHETAALLEIVFAYCRTDILVEESISDVLPDLNAHETAVYRMDQRINERGFQLDMAAVTIALSLITKETKTLNLELSKLTKGQVPRATCRAQMIAWLSENGLDISDTQKETIAALLVPECQNTYTSIVKRALEIMQALGRSSTAKYDTMRAWAAPDGRVRGGLLYHGASTGRWSGAGVQPHNFVRGSAKDMDGLWADLKAGTYKGGVMQGLSQALRGAIVAGPGKTLYVADYSAIEARVVLWLAQDDEALGIFERGEDIYCSMASDIYGYPCNKKDHDSERQVGKQAILGLGFNMGASKFVTACLEKANIVIEEDKAKEVVTAYRQRFWRVKEMWADMEDAAIKAVQYRKPIECGYVTWVVEGVFLYCVLPSGRKLSYPFPKVGQKATPWGELRPQLTFMSINTYTRKWERGHTYGGSLVENITQAVARDVLADAMLRIEDTGIYQVTLTIHDEIVSEGPVEGNLKQFEELMAKTPEWCPGLPIAVEGFSATRYRK